MKTNLTTTLKNWIAGRRNAVATTWRGSLARITNRVAVRVAEIETSGIQMGIAERVNDAIAEVDIEDTVDRRIDQEVSEALRDVDVDQKVNDAIEEINVDRKLEDAIDDAVRDAMNEVDIETRVNAAIADALEEAARALRAGVR